MSSFPSQASKYTNNESSKMLQARMIRARQKITYNNSLTNSIINRILGMEYDEYSRDYDIDFTKNKNLILTLGNELYRNYLNKILKSSSFSDEIKGTITELYESILSSLTIQEQKRAGTYIETDAEKIASKLEKERKLLEKPKFIYYCRMITVGRFKNISISNYRNDDLFTPGEKYVFDLQDESNLGYVLSLSKHKYEFKDINGLYLIGTPGTPGSFLVYEPDIFADYYQVYLYDKIDKSRNSYDDFGYVYDNFVIELNYKSRGNVRSITKYSAIDLKCLLPETIIRPIEYRGSKYIIEPKDFTFVGFGTKDRYSVNRRYGLYYGTYYLLINNLNNPMTILNKGKEHLIQLRGHESNKTEYYLKGLTDDGSLDGSYNFYSGNVEIEVYGDFGSMSLYSYLYGYNLMENLFLFSKDCASATTFRKNYENKGNGAIKCLYPQTTVNFVEINEQPFITFNNNNGNVQYDPTVVYGLYNGQYIIKNISEKHPIAFINQGKESHFHYFGDDTKMYRKIGPDNKVYKYYYNTVIIQVYGDFGKISVYEFYDGYCGGKYLLQYTDICEYESPWRPEKDILTYPDNEDILEFDNTPNNFNINNILHYADFQVSNVSGNKKIYIDNSEFIDVSYSKYGLNQGNFVLLNVPQDTPIAFLNKGREDKFKYDGYFPYKTTSVGPDGFLYDFYYGHINVYVTGDFGRMSMYTLNDGFLNGRHLFIFNKYASLGLAITNYGINSYFPLLTAALNTQESKEFYIDVDVNIVELPYSNTFATYNLNGFDRNGKIDNTQNNPPLTFFIGDVIYFNFSYINRNYTFGIYEIKNLLKDTQLITNNLNITNTQIKWIPNLVIQKYYYYRSSNNSDLMYNYIDILPNDTADLTPIIENINIIEDEIVSADVTNIQIEFSQIMNVNETKKLLFVNENGDIDQSLNITNILGNGSRFITIQTNFDNYNRLKFNTTYILKMEDDFFRNIYLNSIEDEEIITFKTETMHDPKLLSVYPPDISIQININEPIILSFNESVEFITSPHDNEEITYKMTIFNTNIGTSHDICYNNIKSVGNNLEIYSNELDYDTIYTLTIDKNSIVDLSNIPYYFTDNLLNPFTFKTVIDPRPVITQFEPANNELSSFIDTYIYITFDKPVFVNQSSGVILIKDLDQNIVFDAILLNNEDDYSQVYGSGLNTIVIVPYEDLNEDTTYTISIDDECFYDSDNNFFAGLEESDYTFSTGNERNPELVDLNDYVITPPQEASGNEISGN
jgi:hypothetical protein